MNYDEEETRVSGLLPEFGAIFMSNRATKRECFKQKLFGLPSRHAHFVKYVRAGMILFLFEYERRELYGVFQACTDGAVNIVPNAYSSSGQLFPAQVKFTPLWDCIPLSEDEFRDAIKENYFSAKKFNFGLSKNQVHRLLSLFSLRKLKVHRSRRQHTSNEDSISESSSYAKRDGVGDENEMDYQFRQVNSNYPFDESLHNVRKVIDDGRFRMTAGTGNGREMGIEPMAAILTKNLKSNKDFSSRAAISMQNPGLLQPRVNTASIAINLDKLQPYAYSHCQPRQSPRFLHSMEQQASDVLHASSCRDAIVTNTLPYDPDFLSIKYKHSSSPGLHEFVASHNSDGGNIIPFSENQSSASYIEQRGRSQDFDSGYGYSAEYSLNTSRPLFAYSEQRPYSATDLFSENEHSGRIYDSFSPSQYPSFVFDHENTNQEKHDQEILQHETDEAFSSEMSQLQDHISSVEYGNFYSDGQNNRKSVFSRLALSSRAHMEEHGPTVGSDEDSMDTSVDGIMSMLHECQYQWVGTRKPRPLVSNHSASTGKKIKTTSNSKAMKNRQQLVSKQTRKNSIPVDREKENLEQVAVTTPFVDFKRRGKMQKVLDHDMKKGCSNDSTETSGTCKRRKLIRPNFSKNDVADGKSINFVSAENLQGSSVESVAGKDSCKSDIGKQKSSSSVPCEDNRVAAELSKPNPESLM